MRLAEIGSEAVNDGVTDLVEIVHVLARLRIFLSELERGVMERLPRAVGARQDARGGVANMAHAERIDEAVERDLAARRDGAKQIAHRHLAEALDLLELDLGVACLEREDLGRLPDPFLLEEQLDLLLAEAIDVEGAAGHEMLEVLDFLIGAGELAAA